MLLKTNFVLLGQIHITCTNEDINVYWFILQLTYAIQIEPVDSSGDLVK